MEWGALLDTGDGDAVVGAEISDRFHQGIARDKRYQLPAQQRVGGDDGAVQRLLGHGQTRQSQRGGVFLDQAALAGDLIGEEAEAFQDRTQAIAGFPCWFGLVIPQRWRLCVRFSWASPPVFGAVYIRAWRPAHPKSPACRAEWGFQSSASPRCGGA